MEILKVENLCKRYGEKDTEVVALDNVSFTVERGEFVAIIGASGSGKSTLLHLIGGVDRPTSGKVFIDGTDIYELNADKLAIFRRRQVGLIYQFYNLIPILNVVEKYYASMQIRWKGSKRGTSGGTFRNLKSQESKRTSSESTVRRTTAKSVDWACNRELSGDRARRRADGEFG